MTASNLATVIGPALLWSQTQATDGALEQLQSIGLAIKITRLMIENYDKLSSLAKVRETEKQRLQEVLEKLQQVKLFGERRRKGRERLSPLFQTERR